MSVFSIGAIEGRYLLRFLTDVLEASARCGQRERNGEQQGEHEKDSPTIEAV